MAEEATIRMKCPSCGTLGRGKASYLNRDIRCPKCGNTGRFVQVSSHEVAGTGQVRDEPTTASRKSMGTKETVGSRRAAPAGKARPTASAAKWLAIAAMPVVAALGIGGYLLLRPSSTEQTTNAHNQSASGSETNEAAPQRGQTTPTPPASSDIASLPPPTPPPQAPQQVRAPSAPTAAEPAPPPAKLVPYRDALREMSVSTRLSLWTYYITLRTAELQLSMDRKIDPDAQKGIEENRPRFTDEAVAEFQKWLSGSMTGPKEEPLPEASLIRKNAQNIVKLIEAISYSRRDDTPPDYTPSAGFTSGRVVRIGVRNDAEQVLLVGQLGTGTVYNTLRSTEKGRAGTILKERVFGCLRAAHVCAKAVGAKHVGLVYGYGSRDFSEKYGSSDAEVLGFVAALEDCRQFLEQDISQEEFLRRAEIFLFDTRGNMKRIEIMLE